MEAEPTKSVVKGHRRKEGNKRRCPAGPVVVGERDPGETEVKQGEWRHAEPQDAGA